MHVIILEAGQCRIGNGTLELTVSKFKIQLPYPAGIIHNLFIRLTLINFLVKLKFDQLHWHPYITQISNQPNQFWLELQSTEARIGLHMTNINYDPLIAVKHLKGPIIDAVTGLLEAGI